MTSLDGVLSIASGGLAAVQAQIAVVSQNVANASTPNYAAEQVSVSSLDAGGQPSGVTIGATTLVSSPALQQSLYAENATVAYGSTVSTALSAITATAGTTDASTGSDGSLTSAVTTLSSDITTLAADPSDPTQLQTVVDDATSLASAVGTLSSTYATERQTASDGVASSVTAINQSLSAIGALSNQIVLLKAQGQSSADLENQRNAQMSTLSGELSVKFQEQPNGDMLVMTQSGLTLPTNAAGGALSYVSPTLAAGSAYVAGSAQSTIPGIMLNGVDVTGSLTGGTLGADVALRDDVIPTAQAELDSFSSATAQRFAGAGVTLFTDGNGNVPATVAAQVGFSGVMQVSAAVAADPSLIATGTGTGTGTGTATTPSSSVVQGLVTGAFGTPATPLATTGLGPAGTITLPYDGSGTLAQLATNLVAAQGEAASAASDQLSVATGVQTALGTRVSDITGVSTDSEMSTMTALENSYTANAKVVAAVQSMYSELLDAIEVSA